MIINSSILIIIVDDQKKSGLTSFYEKYYNLAMKDFSNTFPLSPPPVFGNIWKIIFLIFNFFEFWISYIKLASQVSGRSPNHETTILCETIESPSKCRAPEFKVYIDNEKNQDMNDSSGDKQSKHSTPQSHFNERDNLDSGDKK